MNLTEYIADFVTGFPNANAVSAPPAENFDILKLSVLDWYTVGVAGIDEPVSTIVRNQALADGGSTNCSVLGSSQKLPAKVAALVNGTTSHALDYDDTHFMHVGHTSVVVLSAAMAIAELRRASGKEFLDAALIGSEVCCHVGHWLGRSHYQAGFHQTATAGTFGATAAACRLLKLNSLQTGHALGLAATRASGLTSQFGTMSKPYHAGMAASNGVEAALLAAGGFTARFDGLECDRGFADTHHAEAQRNNTTMLALGREYVFNAVQHKLHACCHGLHASIEALQSLKHRHGISASSIEAVTIKTNPRWLKVCNIGQPATALESKFSYRHSCALVFSDYDSAALSTYSKECCDDDTLSRIKELTEVIADDTLPDTASTVRIQLHDGHIFEEKHDLSNILSVSVRQQKVVAKSCVLLSETRAVQCWSHVKDMEFMTVSDFSVFCSLLRHPEV